MNLGILAREAYHRSLHLSEEARWRYAANCVAAEILKRPRPISVWTAIAWGVALGSILVFGIQYGLTSY
jgi:hypothetical protein